MMLFYYSSSVGWLSHLHTSLWRGCPVEYDVEMAVLLITMRNA
jgi:hypothetical protein